MPIQPIFSPDQSALRQYLSQWPKTLKSLDQFLLSLRLGDYNNPFSSEASGNVRHPRSPAFRPVDSGDLQGDGDGSDHDNDDAGDAAFSSLPRTAPRINRNTLTLKALELIRTVIGTTRWSSGAELLIILEGLGREFHSSYGKDPCLANIVRRVMNLVRGECDNVLSDNPPVGHPGNLTVNTTNLPNSTSNNAMSPPSQPSRTPSMTSLMFAQSAAMAAASQLPDTDLMSQHAARFRSDSLANSDESTPSSPPPSSSTPNPSNVSGVAAKVPPQYFEYRSDFRQLVMEAIQEVMDDLSDSSKSINDQSHLHIHSAQTILTYSSSKTILSFLKNAHTKYKRRFNVIVAEGAPHFGGWGMAKALEKAGIDATVINDSAIAAIMPRVDTLLLPAHAVLANGGVIGPSGSHLCALAAHENRVPVVVVTSIGFKLCPSYPHYGQDTYQDLQSPSVLLPPDPEAYWLDGSKVDLVSPVHDYIGPELVSLFVTNIGGYQPSYVYRLLVELYCPDDPVIFEE
mmetsp:Transcript_13307/g.27289  ORF Transcript_13307/g.27289 Transcript_13307/m.27289 type:complete len:514 (-) Transcript_13307:39-1580(-)